MDSGDFPGGSVIKNPPSSARSASLIPSEGTKIPHASRPKNQNIKQKQYCNKFNKDFKTDLYKQNLKKKMNGGEVWSYSKDNALKNYCIKSNMSN